MASLTPRLTRVPAQQRYMLKIFRSGAARFASPSKQPTTTDAAKCHIKSSNGASQLRPVIETMIQIGTHQFVTLITLTDRADMGVPMLLGRDTLKGRFLVNPSRSYLLSRRKASA
jgi:hypothetical protein